MSNFVVINRETQTIVKQYPSERGAKIAATRANNAENIGKYGVMTLEQFNRRNETMVVKSLMTGQMVEIPANTPWCCNPASETYWSM